MELREAYRVLELGEGASGDEAKDARTLLAKVWHPDRHANDPALQKKAEVKLAQINEAFDALKAAGFPAKVTVVPATHERYAPPGATIGAAAPVPPVTTSHVEFVPRRRIRLWVIAVLSIALGIGAYVAISQLTAEPSRPTPVAVISHDASIAGDAPIPSPADASVPGDDASTPAPDAAVLPSTTKTFGLGASHDEVLAAQGTPSARDTVINEEWSYGFSYVEFDHRGRVVGWWERDTPLHTELVPSDPAVAAAAKARGSFSVGASKDEVIGVEGTPRLITTVINEEWSYGSQGLGGTVEFDHSGRVTAYQDFSHQLRIK